MFQANSIDIPEIVRMKPGALDRLGLYLQRKSFKTVRFFYSDGLLEDLINRARESFKKYDIQVVDSQAVSEISYKDIQRLFISGDRSASAVVGLGGGKALDTAKYLSFLMRKPFYSVPTSLSNDGFASSNSSLKAEGKRISVPSAMPYAVIVDTEVCLRAPKALWLSGVGDLVSKITAVQDWKLAFHEKGEKVNDFAALLSDATVFQFIANPTYDLQGVKSLANALMLNGIAMGIAGSSRPASGSEHLISHALDLISEKPALHGVQVGFATYLISHLFPEGKDRIDELFSDTGFWEYLKERPLSKQELLKALEMAPDIKKNFHTILSDEKNRVELAQLLNSEKLQGYLR